MAGSSQVAATSSIRARAWLDFQRLIRKHRFSVFAAITAALGAGVGALAPSNASGGTRFLTATIAALAAPSLTYVFALLWSFLCAPFRQRRELIAQQVRSESLPQPLIKMEAAVESRKIHTMSMGPNYHLSVAFVRVYNAQEHGGDAATAKHVLPEVLIFGPGDKLLSHNKGWDVNAWRDFTTSQEEHALWLVAKREDSDGCFLIEKEDTTSTMRLSDGTYVAEIILRGYMPDSPIRKRFVFSSRGSGTSLSLEEEQ